MKKLALARLLTLASAAAWSTAASAQGIYGQVPPPGCLYGTSTDIVCNITPNDVVVNGHVVGRDPDPRIRAELRRDAPRIYGY